MTWRFHFPLRNYDFKWIVYNIIVLEEIRYNFQYILTWISVVFLGIYNPFVYD